MIPLHSPSECSTRRRTGSNDISVDYYQQPEKLRVIMMGNGIKKAAAHKIQTATSTRVASIIYASYSIHFVTNKQRLAHKDH